MGNGEKECEDHILSHWDQYKLKISITGHVQQDILSKVHFFKRQSLIKTCLPHVTQDLPLEQAWRDFLASGAASDQKMDDMLDKLKSDIDATPTETSCRALSIQHLKTEHDGIVGAISIAQLNLKAHAYAAWLSFCCFFH